MSERPWWQKGVAGGLGAMTATVFTSPLDVIKVRRQMFGELEAKGTVNTLTTAREIYKMEGMRGFYRGVTAGVFRQSIYSTSRFGAVGVLTQRFQPSSLIERVPLTMAAGAFGSLLSSPADLVMLRMQADGRLPPEARRNYRNPFHAMGQIVAKGGVLSLWEGCGPNINRAMIVTTTQVVPYEYTKQFLLGQSYLPLQNGLHVHTLASLVAGFVTVVIACPADVVRARIMNAGVMERLKFYAADSVDCYGFTPKIAKYNGSVDCVRQIIETEGPLGLYKGFWAYYARVGPYVISLFVFLEQYQKLLDRTREGFR